jgi:hypothetical protein
MGGKSSKAKGSAGEREIARIFTGIFGGSWIRVPASGGFVGGKNAIRKSVLSQSQTRAAKGDLIPPDHMPKFVVECKNYISFKFHQLFTPGKSIQLDDWIKQTIDCIDAGDQWFVCFKITRVGIFVAVPDHNQGYSFGNYCNYTGEYGKFQVTELSDFFTRNKDLIMDLCKPEISI